MCRLLEAHAGPDSLGPDNAALLPGRTVKQLEAAGQRDLPADFDARPAGRIVDNVAIDGGLFRAKDDGGRPGHLSRWTNPFVEPRLCHADTFEMEDALISVQSWHRSR